jgi:ATPase family associated with various cellular activities (AAA)/Winged helix domain, variant
VSDLAHQPWMASNQAYLLAELARVRAAIAHTEPGVGQAALDIQAAMDDLPALQRITVTFRLSPFERDVLLMCAGVELDAWFAAACRGAQDDRATPTFSLALAALSGAHWSALTPNAPLRYWRLIEVGAGEGLVTSPLRVDERILHYLAGISYRDERVDALVRAYAPPAKLPPTHQAVADRIAAVWGDDLAAESPLQLCGADADTLCDVAASAASDCGLELQVMRAADIPVGAADRERLIRLWDREAALGASALLISVREDAGADQDAVAGFVGRAQSPLFVAGREPLRVSERALLRFDVNKPSSAEQVELWRDALGSANGAAGEQVAGLVNQFDMGRPAIAVASAVALRDARGDVDAAAGLLWETCRDRSRARLDDLAQRIATDATWEDLVLPEPAMQTLRQIVTHVRRRSRVYDDWGFAAKSSRGLGLTALFFGSSGTGKTLAADIMASELRLDLYRIDLSQVVSKYIGETEKNLRRVFDAAEEAGAVLLFDEADALFGKRTEIKDSHDRYANVEVSYLLQRMEAYRGLAILTTNMRQALDPAFTRRIRFIVQFPFPDEAHRAEIWRRAFPAATPTDGLDIGRLARLNVAGGNIRNVAMDAAFLAADENRPVGMAHLLRAARAEYAKLERPLTAGEIAGWQS